MKKTLPKLIIVEVTHDDGFKYELTCRELFDAVVIDKCKYPNKTASYIVKRSTTDTEMPISPRLTLINSHKKCYEDYYSYADARNHQ